MKWIKTITIALVMGLTFPAFAQDAVAPDVIEAADVVEVTDVVAPADATPVPAPTPPTKVDTTEDAAEAVDVLVDAAREGHWPLFTGMLIMLLVWLLDKVVKLRDRVGKAVLPWIAAGLGILGSVGAALATGGLVWGQALIQGFLAGASAVGFWELLFKHLKATPEKEPSRTPGGNS